MNLQKCLTLVMALVALCVVSAHALVPIGVFPPTAIENFDALVVDTYDEIKGFSGMGQFTRMPNSQILRVASNPVMLPPLSWPNIMAGQDTDVRIEFETPLNRFGGYFRALNFGVVIDSIKIAFYLEGVLVGSASVRIDNNNWSWIGYDVSVVGGYDMVEIYSGGPPRGYVGMDDLHID